MASVLVREPPTGVHSWGILPRKLAGFSDINDGSEPAGTNPIDMVPVRPNRQREGTRQVVFRWGRFWLPRDILPVGEPNLSHEEV